ncbi:hypothetical protein BDZ88DRAFT_510479 [Geranomyces variabilis]|nr:hypothetical protein BDZ88DRAFT_510479 [Geranomyces variabilis]KAJ3131458.1 hypothetical protein HDU90_008267 [Geranomyces variabilis]
MSRRRRRSFNLQSFPRTPPLGSPPPLSKRRRWNEEAAHHAAIFVGDAGAMQLDEAEVDAHNGLRWRAPQRWANSHGPPPPPPLPPAERAKRSSPPSNYVCVKARFGSIIHDNKAAEVARLQVFLRHVHLITQRASWIMKLWYANMPHPERAQILTDNDVKHLLDALNYGEITRGGIFQTTLNEYDTYVETLTAVSQGPGCGRSHLQNTIAYTATSLVTNLEVNVSVNFMKKLRQYVERRFRMKAILRELNHVTDKRIHEFLCKRLRRRFNRLWRLITNQDVLADGKLPAFEAASDSVFFDIWGDILCILPADPKSLEFNLAYAVACEPAKYVGAYCALSRLWQAAQFPALFSAIPVRTSHVQSYVPIDTRTLLDVILRLRSSSEPHSTHEQKLRYWNMLCDVSHKSFQDRGNYKFSGTIMMDGVGVSVRHVDMSKVTVTTKGRPVMPKPCKVSKADKQAAVDKLYVDTPENAAVIRDRILHPDPNAPVVLCDPNVRDMLYLKEYGTNNIMRYTLLQQKKETKSRERVKECNKDRLRNLPAPGGGFLEATMPGHKSMLANDFNQWLAFQVQHRLAFENCYAATTRWRRRQFEAFRLARKSKDQFVNRLRKQFGQDPFIIMGDWSAAPRSMRFHLPIKTARFRTMLCRHHILMMYIDEFRTSSCCPFVIRKPGQQDKVCGAIVKSGFRTRQSPRPWKSGHTVEVHGLLGCTSRECTKDQWTLDSDLGKRVRYHNRDRASVENFEHIICEQIVKEGERPAHLSRGNRGKNF